MLKRNKKNDENGLASKLIQFKINVNMYSFQMQVGIGEASTAREAPAHGTCEDIRDHHQRPHHHLAHDHRQQQQQHQQQHQQQQQQQHHTHHQQIATTAFHISRPSHPISTIISPSPLHHTSIILDEDSYHVSRIMLQNESFQVLKQNPVVFI